MTKSQSLKGDKEDPLSALLFNLAPRFALKELRVRGTIAL